MGFWNHLVPEMAVTDFAKSMEFYTSILGFSERFSRSKPRFCYLELGQAQIMLEELEEASWITGNMKYPFGRGLNLQIEVSDISGLYRRVEESGFPLYRELTVSWYQTGNTKSGQKEFLIQDPDGYLLRFCEFIGEGEVEV